MLCTNNALAKQIGNVQKVLHYTTLVESYACDPILTLPEKLKVTD